MVRLNDEIARNCIDLIIGNSPFRVEMLSYEIQDDFGFILISVVTDGVSDFSPLDRKKIARIVDDVVPKRSNEYSWMINFILHGSVFDSYFGGDLMSPDSGL